MDKHKKQFKRNAIQMILDGATLTETADRLHITTDTLALWYSQRTSIIAAVPDATEIKPRPASRPPPRVFTNEEMLEAVARVQAGEDPLFVGKEYGVSTGRINGWVKKLGTPISPISLGLVTEFAKRVRSVLSRGSGRKGFDRWHAKVASLTSEGYSPEEAWVTASKDHECLYPLFHDYDLSPFDRDPKSHPDIVHAKDMPGPVEVIDSEGRSMSYRECLRWAIAAAGLHLRTMVHPEVVPCDTAFYLYKQALAAPKDFMTKVTQVESKEDEETRLDRSTRKQTERTVDELKQMLGGIGNGEASGKAEVPERQAEKDIETPEQNDIQSQGV